MDRAGNPALWLSLLGAPPGSGDEIARVDLRRGDAQDGQLQAGETIHRQAHAAADRGFVDVAEVDAAAEHDAVLAVVERADDIAPAPAAKTK